MSAAALVLLAWAVEAGGETLAEGEVIHDIAWDVVLSESARFVPQTDTITVRFWSTSEGNCCWGVALDAVRLERIAAGCTEADLVEPFGLLDLADIVAFSDAFLSDDPSADLDGNELFDLADVTRFAESFLLGCP